MDDLAQWWRCNTFNSQDFSNLSKLVDVKKEKNLHISLCLPTKNECRTISKIIQTIKSELMEPFPLLDEIVVIDSQSCDGTDEIARSCGVPVYQDKDILVSEGNRKGKGEALWKSLHALNGDIILWIDTDIENIHPKFVYGLAGPLIMRDDIEFVKGFYDRPLKLNGQLIPLQGGRVTELCVRPLLNLLFPELRGIIQPLSGEYGARRSLLENIPFFCGYGVETGLLIDISQKYSLNLLGQTNLQSRIHRHHSLSRLSLMSFEIIQVILTRLEEYKKVRLMEEFNNTIINFKVYEDFFISYSHSLKIEERPPIITIPDYVKGKTK